MNNDGKFGERLFKQIMESRNYEVVDVSNNNTYWDKDIDFLVTSPTSGDTKSFEVKWDSKINQTGNLYLELENIHSKNFRGWFEFCQADYVAYGDAVAQVFYIIPLLELKKRAQEIPFRQARCGDDSIGQLVNLKDIKDLVKIL